MNVRLITILPIIFLAVLSCGEHDEIFNYTYLKMGEQEYLYIYNQSQKYLCVDKESDFCNIHFNQYYSKHESSYYDDDDNETISFSMFFDSNQSFALKQRYAHSSSTIFFLLDKNELMRYSEAYYTAQQQSINYGISPIQSPMMCDISGVIELLLTICQIYNIDVSDIYIDMNNLQMIPEVCRLNSLTNCLKNAGILNQKENSIKSEDLVYNISMNCISQVYSIEKLY